jgi:hypothetical protein
MGYVPSVPTFPEKFMSFPGWGQTRAGIGDRAIQNRPSLADADRERVLGAGGEGSWRSSEKD